LAEVWDDRVGAGADTCGRGLARRLGLGELFRFKQFPLAFSLPWGLTPGPFMPYIPFPIHIRLRFGEPIAFHERPGADPEDPAPGRRDALHTLVGWGRFSDP